MQLRAGPGEGVLDDLAGTHEAVMVAVGAYQRPSRRSLLTRASAEPSPGRHARVRASLRAPSRQSHQAGRQLHPDQVFPPSHARPSSPILTTQNYAGRECQLPGGRTLGCARRILARVPCACRWSSKGVPSAGTDEPRPAVDTESAALPARHSVLGAVAQRGPSKVRVHHAPALRTVAHRRVAPPVVHVFADGTRA